MRYITFSCCLLLILISGRLSAEDAVPEPPDTPPSVQSGESLEPDITIIRRGDKTIHEYRVNGELYMVKIIPRIGPPYYLIDSDGDGSLDIRRSDLEEGTQVPQWVLFSW